MSDNVRAARKIDNVVDRAVPCSMLIRHGKAAKFGIARRSARSTLTAPYKARRRGIAD